MLKAIKNAGHVPLFGIMSLVLLGMSSVLLKKRIHKRRWHYLIAFLMTGLVGFLSELFQKFTPRDADFWDIMRDAAGAAIFLLVWMTFDGRMHEKMKQFGRWIRPVIWLTVLVIVLIAASPVLQWSIAYKHRSDIFPVLCSFETDNETKFFDTCRSHLKTVATPSGWKNSSTGRVGRWNIPAESWPQVYLEPYPDWRGYKALAFETFLPGDTIVKAYVRIADYTRDGTEYKRLITIYPGESEFSISLHEVEKASGGRRLDMSNIRVVYLLFERTTAPITLYVDNLRLIK